MALPQMPVHIRSVLLLGDQLPTQCRQPTVTSLFESAIFVCFDRPEFIPVTVTSPSMDTPVEPHRAYLLRGNLLPRFHDSNTTLLVTSTAYATFDPRIDNNHLSPRALISSIGRVTECHFSQQDQRWIVRALHRDYDPMYTLQRAIMRDIGLELFAVGNILGFNGTIFGYDQDHARWIIHLYEAEPMQQ
ncbi:uncharacterized protein MELLADRAFT_90770 [Melampsora larici-populina 98AG31]|uniref:Uncharacterized protein n=1 Tax=Melampsora larici-populina (strain 98AG31 / pathotype 3-4-7) TaxID=747676 RepID=F4R7F3_MELLP|nr:uncharacterized protein MELLADRAFT_90770 [Melampsora larici-populina 98AG31]EGG11306.1 hypothetical protein MELLADRAFT_90770 [Melampsora larici-populina 98AG31]